MELNAEYISSNFEVVYCEYYNNYHRLRIKTDRTNKYGKVYIMLTRVNRPIHFYLYFENGLYFRYGLHFSLSLYFFACIGRYASAGHFHSLFS